MRAPVRGLRQRREAPGRGPAPPRPGAFRIWGSEAVPRWDVDRAGNPGANLAPCGLEMSDLSEQARLVLDSLETKPALNTPALIAQNEGIEREEAEAGLEELADAGLARQSMMGWKLRR